ncbi:MULTISPECIES: KGG domain-containing protein [unclassified Acidovorax]|uniref:KGG domain-containing protein n=1 Tax=unclassified Acidovorax TaxID=2684926 RepID=UPI000C1A0C46|nr:MULTISPECIES: KGG domain-containing protein [unclassified Acidovorax]PIF16803.1 hypothetical protein CLU87_0711 [Acidovorax sp. 59]PKW04171.1 hypothetical protein CLU89_3848 [Acidovorax sp. 30]
MDTTLRPTRGFAQMPPEQRRQIASRGGLAARANGTALRFTHEEAVAAARRGAELRPWKARFWISANA